jgi:hypothetical protein
MTAKAFHISAATARKLAAEGTLPVVKLGPCISRWPLHLHRPRLAAQAAGAHEPAVGAQLETVVHPCALCG